MPSNKTDTQPTSLTYDLYYALRYYLGGRRAVIIGLLAVLSLAAYLNWGWLAAAGIAPLLISLLPCAAMCALGLCMRKGAGGRCRDSDDVDGKPRNASAEHDEP